jgi:hypothetical protein
MGIAYNPKIVTDGLVLCLDAANVKSYPGSGTSINDLSGNGNNGTLVNGPTFDSSNGGSIVFDGSNDFINTANIQFERTDAFTLSAWVKSSSPPNNQIINNENMDYRGYMLVINSGDSKILFGLRHTTSNRIQVTSSNIVISNVWHYLTATYDGSSTASGVELYINSIKQAKTTLADNLSLTTISNQTTYIGIRRPATPGPFRGNISNTQIYNRALSPAEIRQNFNATRGRYGI